MINVQGLTCEAATLNYKKKFGIKIISPHRTYYLACEDETEQEHWIKEINNSSLRNSDYRLHVVDADQSEDATFHDIQKAIDMAKDGDHIVLRSGVYKVPDTIVIKKPVTIRGVYPDHTLVSICSADNSKPILRVDNFNENLTLQQIEKQKLSEGGGFVKFEHLTLTQNASKDSIVFYEAVSCLEVVSGKCSVDHVNICAAHGCGISVKNRMYSKSLPATTSGNESPVPGKKPSHEPTQVIITDCYIQENKIHGVKFDDNAVGEITKCIIQKNDGYGLLCLGESEVVIQRSVLSHHSKNAIMLDSSKTISIIGNKLQANGQGGKNHISQSEKSAPCASEKNEFL